MIPNTPNSILNTYCYYIEIYKILKKSNFWKINRINTLKVYNKKYNQYWLNNVGFNT